MRILCTGGSGYLGSILCETLLDAGHYVIVLDNFRHGIQSLNHLCSNSGLKIVRGDARDPDQIQSLSRGCYAIIALAGIVGVRECENDKDAAWSTNLRAIKSLCEMDSASRIVFPNTNSGYGISGEPICREESPLKPISVYGLSKCAAENVLRQRGNYTVFRLATVFGMSPRMRWDLMVNDFVYRAVKDRCITLFEPNFRRNFIHVRDVARAFLWAIENPEVTDDQVFNLGLDDANLTKRGLAERIQKQVEFHISEAELASDPDKRDYFVSNEKIAKAGFKPVYSLDDGIKELIKGVRQYG